MRLFGYVATAMLVLAAALAASPLRAAEDGLWVAQTDSIPVRSTAYATVAPRAVVEIRAGETGILDGFAVQPGDQVAANAVLGRLVGPTVSQTLRTREAAVASAESTVAAAQQMLSVDRANRTSRLATRGALANAEDALSKAQAQLETARAQLSEAQDLAVLRAPQAGRVLTVSAAAGERLAAGETIVTLEPAGDLWLRAAFYGADADSIRVGMPGSFAPAGGDAPIAVRVSAIVGALLPDGGRTVTLTSADAAPNWLNGESGTVTVDTGMLSGVIVPTQALILDQARWWVLIHTAGGDQPQRVTPGPSRGATTLIEKGLSPGTQVVVANAYLKFHRDIGERYQPPD